MELTVTHERSRLAALEPALKARAMALRAARRFFEERGFLEVDTPVRVSTPALELHIDAEPSGESFLRTSPELHMKRLLASGCDRVFQIGKCFRRGEKGALHNPEFTMLEWYRANADYMEIMAEAKELLVSVARSVLGRSWLMFGDTRIELDGDWHVATVADTFAELAGWDPVETFDPDRFDMDMVEKIEPGLPAGRPAVLKDFPAEAAALARLKPGNPRVAERWELYVGGIEIANAFSELVDAAEQRRRFERCVKQRQAMGKDAYQIDEAFLSSMERGMPPCAGAALGFDRLVMLLCNARSLDEVLPFRQ